jgi:hypothetical protein
MPSAFRRREAIEVVVRFEVVVSYLLKGQCSSTAKLVAAAWMPCGTADLTQEFLEELLFSGGRRERY